jgi:dolichyl-phosphate-mannose-protein mannosyltransferase
MPLLQVHFGKFTGWYLKRWFSFDIHPPLGKLTFMAAGILTGYDESKCDYEPPAGRSTMYAADCEYWKLRGTAAAFSTACVVLVYLLARRLGSSQVGRRR